MPSFALKNGGPGDFSKKMDAVFGNLNALEENHQKWEGINAHENENYIKPDPILEENLSSRTRSALSRINDFKAPFPTQIRKRTHHMASNSQWNRSGFQKDPQKWTKYTLADVSDYEMSDKSNTKAAMSFLAERKQQKLEEEEAKNEKIQFNKPMFRKPSGNKTSAIISKLDESEGKMDTDSNVATTSGLSKIIHVMPECIVGQGGQKQKKRAIRSKITITDEAEEENEEVLNIIPTPKKSITLNHLEDEAEDSDT